MKILSVQGADVGGAAWRWANMLRTDLGYKVFRFQQTSLDLGFPRGRPLDQVMDQASEADVIHFHTYPVAAAWYPKLKQFDKPMSMTLHGIESLGALKFSDIPAVFVTPNLAHLVENSVFIPNTVHQRDYELNLNSYRAIRIIRPNSYVRKYKNWGELDIIAAHAEIPVKKFDQFIPNKIWVERDVISSWFVWDHFQGYWGQTTIEAFMVGSIPVVGPSRDARRMAAGFFGKEPPFGPETPSEWINVLRRSRWDAEFVIQMGIERREFYLNYMVSDIIPRAWKSFLESRAA